ncbi:hypothetical protein ACFL1B_02220 [Nanoarchaeota archaeon]
MKGLPERFQEKLNDSTNPVVVMISAEGSGTELREKIIRSIGVDLW